MFEDDSPSPHVGCVCSLEVISTLLEAGNYKHITKQTHPQKMSPSFSRNRGFSKEIWNYRLFQIGKHFPISRGEHKNLFETTNRSSLPFSTGSNSPRCKTWPRLDGFQALGALDTRKSGQVLFRFFFAQSHPGISPRMREKSRPTPEETKPMCYKCNVGRNIYLSWMAYINFM